MQLSLTDQSFLVVFIRVRLYSLLHHRNLTSQTTRLNDPSDSNNDFHWILITQLNKDNAQLIYLCKTVTNLNNTNNKSPGICRVFTKNISFLSFCVTSREEIIFPRREGTYLTRRCSSSNSLGDWYEQYLCRARPRAVWVLHFKKVQDVPSFLWESSAKVMNDSNREGRNRKPTLVGEQYCSYQSPREFEELYLPENLPSGEI